MHDRLRQLQEYVQDTEDLVAMELDNARNALVRVSEHAASVGQAGAAG